MRLRAILRKKPDHEGHEDGHGKLRVDIAAHPVSLPNENDVCKAGCDGESAEDHGAQGDAQGGVEVVFSLGGFFGRRHCGRAHAATGGRRLAHGRAASSCAASRKRMASSPKGATNWVPRGKPAPFQ